MVGYIEDDSVFYPTMAVAMMRCDMMRRWFVVPV